MTRMDEARPHRICFVTSGLFTGGAEVALIGLVAAIDRDLYEPIVISLRSGGSGVQRLQRLSIELYELGWPPAKPSISGIWQLGRLLHRLKPDLVQGWMYHGNVAACLARLVRPGAPVTWSIHSTTSDLASERATTRAVIRGGALVARAAKKIVYCSRLGARQHEALGYPASRSVVIPNGYDCRQFAPRPARRVELRGELGIPGEAMLVGLVARYHPVKDHATFLRAAAIIARRESHVHFLLAGKQVDDRNEELRQLIIELALQQRVHLLGERGDIPELLAGLDVACLSSTAEAFPNAIGEAMASGIPCVATDVGDAEWMMGDTGRVVPTKDPAALANAVLGLLTLGAEERRSLGLAARARVLERFTAEATVEAYEELYRSILGRSEEQAPSRDNAEWRISVGDGARRSG